LVVFFLVFFGLSSWALHIFCSILEEIAGWWLFTFDRSATYCQLETILGGKPTRPSDTASVSAGLASFCRCSCHEAVVLSGEADQPPP
jgi:hypothetical protein